MFGKVTVKLFFKVTLLCNFIFAVISKFNFDVISIIIQYHIIYTTEKLNKEYLTKFPLLTKILIFIFINGILREENEVLIRHELVSSIQLRYF